MQASANPSSGDLLGSSTVDLTSTGSSSATNSPFDAIIAIGVLIKGDTVHFEHIAESVSRGLMRVQLDFGVPVIFGLLVGRRILEISGDRSGDEGGGGVGLVQGNGG